ncbi:hypothetical protein H8959_016925 [Pygathrix nigripes]
MSLARTPRSRAALPKASVSGEALGSGQREASVGQQGVAAGSLVGSSQEAQGKERSSTLRAHRQFLAENSMEFRAGGVSQALGAAGRGAWDGRPGARSGSVGSSGWVAGAPLAVTLTPGCAWDVPSLSPCPPGLVVLNISQLRYRTVELLRTTGPSARVPSTVGSPSCGERRPRRPWDRPRRLRIPGTGPCAQIPAGRAPTALLQPPGPRRRTGRHGLALGDSSRQAQPRRVLPGPGVPSSRGPRVTGQLSSERQRPARRRLLCRVAALPGAGMRPRRAGPTGFSGRGGSRAHRSRD